ncbi:hypothetical protein MMC12_007536 [Toensbergia leucococca]|nr:hypothetical protein [Toensbergia leucococca]
MGASSSRIVSDPFLAAFHPTPSFRRLDFQHKGLDLFGTNLFSSRAISGNVSLPLDTSLSMRPADRACLTYAPIFAHASTESILATWIAGTVVIITLNLFIFALFLFPPEINPSQKHMKSAALFRIRLASALLLLALICLIFNGMAISGAQFCSGDPGYSDEKWTFPWVTYGVLGLGLTLMGAWTVWKMWKAYQSLPAYDIKGKKRIESLESGFKGDIEMGQMPTVVSQGVVQSMDRKASEAPCGECAKDKGKWKEVSWDCGTPRGESHTCWKGSRPIYSRQRTRSSSPCENVAPEDVTVDGCALEIGIGSSSIAAERESRRSIAGSYADNFNARASTIAIFVPSLPSSPSPPPNRRLRSSRNRESVGMRNSCETRTLEEATTKSSEHIRVLRETPRGSVSWVQDDSIEPNPAIPVPSAKGRRVDWFTL